MVWQGYPQQVVQIENSYSLHYLIPYMPLVYLITLLLTVQLASWTENYRKNELVDNTSLKNPWLWPLIAVLVFVAGFRYDTGVDFWAYYVGFKANFAGCIQSLLSFKEPGIRFLSWLSRSVYDNGISLIFVSSLVTVFLYVITLYKFSPLFVASMVLYIFMGEWQGSFNGVRQFLASAILFAGHRYIFNRDLPRYCLCVFLATLFHTSAIVMIVPYYTLCKPIINKYLIRLVVGAGVMLLNYRYIFQGIGYYKGTTMDMTDSYMTNSVSVSRIVVSLVPVILFFFLRNGGKVDKKCEFYVNGLILNGIVMITTMHSTYLARLGIYTNAMCLIGYPYLFQMAYERFKSNTVKFCALALYSAYWWYSIVAFDSLRNYQFWF